MNDLPPTPPADLLPPPEPMRFAPGELSGDTGD
jgi:hypothetical protein